MEEDREVWWLNLELYPCNPYGKSGNEERRTLPSSVPDEFFYLAYYDLDEILLQRDWVVFLYVFKVLVFISIVDGALSAVALQLRAPPPK